jgi:hypothetical protein
MTGTTAGQLMSAVDSIRETLEGCAEEAERSGFYPERIGPRPTPGRRLSRACSWPTM